MSDTSSMKHPSWLTSGDFTAADDPFVLFAAWLDQATASEPRDPTAMTLATVDDDGMPNARMVLLKGADAQGFVFFTNMASQKGRELDAHAQGGAGVPLEVAQQAGARARPGRARHRGRGRRLFRHAGEAGADRRLGEPAVARRWRAASPSRRRSPSTPRNTRSAPCRGRLIGRATASCRWRWSSGRTGRSACTTASISAAPAPDAPWTKTRLYP